MTEKCESPLEVMASQYLGLEATEEQMVGKIVSGDIETRPVVVTPSSQSTTRR